jgi:hypothetical protein
LDTPGTAAVPEATEAFALPEPAQEALATETEGLTDATDSGDEATGEDDPLAGLTDEQLLQHARVQAALKGVEARKEESFRQREENARRAAAEAAEAEQFAQLRQQASREGTAYLLRGIHGAVADLFNKGIDVTTTDGIREFANRTGQMVQSLETGTRVRSLVEMTAQFEQHIAAQFPGYALPQELNQEYGAALRRQDMGAIVKAVTAITKDAAAKALSPALRAEVEADLRNKNEASSAVAKTRATQEARAANGGGPTPGLTPATGGRGFRTVQEADKAVMDGTWKPKNRADYAARTAGLPFA